MIQSAQRITRIPAKLIWAVFFLLATILFPSITHPEIPGTANGAKFFAKPTWDGSGAYVWTINHDKGMPWSLFNVSNTLTIKITLATHANIWLKSSGDTDGKYIDVERVIHNRFKDFEVERP